MNHPALALLAALAIGAIGTPSSFAAQRTFVGSNGLDTNPCTLAQPCRSFATALTQTSDGGEVIVLDSAGYGAVSIGQNVSIVAPPGIYAGITVFSGSGVSLNGQPSNRRVVLRGLTITSQGGHNGIALAFGGGNLHIEDCAIHGFAAVGNSQAIYVANDADAKVFVSNTVVRGGREGIGLAADLGAPLAVTLDRVRISDMTGSALYLYGQVQAEIRDSALTSSAIGVNVGQSGDAVLSLNIARSNISGSSSWGLYMNLAGGTALARGDVAISESEVSDNASGGIFAAGFTATGTVVVRNSTLARNSGSGALRANTNGTIRLMGSAIVGNTVGWSVGTGSVLSLGNNMIEGNAGGDTAPPSITPK